MINKFMLKIMLTALAVTAFLSASAFAESEFSIEVSPQTIKSLESVLVTGTITGVSDYKPVRLSVMSPDGAIVYAPLVSIEDDKFRKLLQPTIPSFKEGIYTITASHEELGTNVQAQFIVTAQEIPRNPTDESSKDETIREPSKQVSSGISISADAINGSDVIEISGITNYKATDVTLIVTSPIGNIVTIAQVTPETYGNFDAQIKVGGPLWKEDGTYTITASQGTASERTESIEVEIEDGVVVPEFGMFASLVLAISIIAVIMISTKMKINILPRYQ